MPLEWQPGTRRQYSVGSDVTGRVVEVVCGMTPHKFLAKRIFEPLGMTDTGFCLPDTGISRFPPPYFDGVGFGLLRSAVLDPAKAGISAQPGDFGWVGAAGTFFRVSPVADMIVILFTQLFPSSAIPVRKELRALVPAPLTGARDAKARAAAMPGPPSVRALAYP